MSIIKNNNEEYKIRRARQRRKTKKRTRNTLTTGKRGVKTNSIT